MTTVTVENNKITVEGHSGYAPLGQDIVCSGISALTITLCSAIEELTLDDITTKQSDGFIEIEYTDITPSTKVLVRAFLIGITGILQEYPNNIKLVRDDGKL